MNEIVTSVLIPLLPSLADAVIGAVGTVALVMWRKFAKRRHLDDSLTIWAETAVAEVYEQAIRPWKEAALDNKLTEEQRAAAREKAVEKIIQISGKKATRLLKEYSRRELEGIVQRTVDGKKAMASIAQEAN